MNDHYRPIVIALPLLSGMLVAPHTIQAAESYDNCSGFIDTIPTTIKTQGVWCLRHDLAANITSGAAIDIQTNNVTIDCNDFKLGGLAAGNGSKAVGIHALDRQNITVRHCNIRGFNIGAWIYRGAGHLVEDNRLDNNLYVGIYVKGDNSLVRRNLVYDTGGATGGVISYGILAGAEIVDNAISGVFVDAYQLGGFLAGVGVEGKTFRVSGNTISGLGETSRTGGQETAGYGIFALYNGGPSMIRGNGLFGPGDIAVVTDPDSRSSCQDNVSFGFTGTMTTSCSDDGGNAWH